MSTAYAPGKIVLSGEYAMVFGRPGIAMPAKMGMEVIFEKDQPSNHLTISWKNGDPGDKWSSYLEHIINQMAGWLDGKPVGTLTINNNLPLGKGMGSSTALVIAVCRAVFGEDCREQALNIEDVVNPGNSGMDFNVIWENAPIRYQKSQNAEYIELSPTLLKDALLIDTGKPNETTAELVSWVKSREAELQDAFDLIGDCTEALMRGEHPITVFPDHHRAQLAIGVVPDHVHELVLKIEQLGGSAKVIGAGGRTGGGGMVLAVHQDPAILQSACSDFPLLSV